MKTNNLRESIEFGSKLVVTGGESVDIFKMIAHICSDLGLKCKIINTPDLLSKGEVLVHLNEWIEEGVNVFVFDGIERIKLSVLEAILEIEAHDIKMIFNFLEADPKFAFPAQAAFKQWIHTHNEIKEIELNI